MLISSHIREKKGSSLGNTNIHLNLCPIILWIRNVCGINWQKLFAVFFFFLNADVFSPDYMQVQIHIHVETHISYTITVVFLQLEI